MKNKCLLKKKKKKKITIKVSNYFLPFFFAPAFLAAFFFAAMDITSFWIINHIHNNQDIRHTLGKHYQLHFHNTDILSFFYNPHTM